MWAENVQSRPSRYRTHGKELADGLENILAFMERLHAESMEIFSKLTDEDLQRKCKTPGGTEITHLEVAARHDRARRSPSRPNLSVPFDAWTCRHLRLSSDLPPNKYVRAAPLPASEPLDLVGFPQSRGYNLACSKHWIACPGFPGPLRLRTFLTKNQQRHPRSDAHVRALADTYLAASFERNPGADHAIRRARPPAGQADRQLTRSVESVAGARRRHGSPKRKQIDPATISAPPLRATYALVREALEGPIALARVPQRIVDGQPVRERVAGAGRLPGHDSAGRHRRSAQRRAGALGLAAEIRRYRNLQSSRRHQSGLHRAQRQRAHHDRSDEHAARGADFRFAV